MADESVFGPLQVIDLMKALAADIINIKLMKTGGISNALRIADIAALYGGECMIGRMLDIRISVAAAVQVAVAQSGVINKRSNERRGGDRGVSKGEYRVWSL